MVLLFFHPANWISEFLKRSRNPPKLFFNFLRNLNPDKNLFEPNGYDNTVKNYDYVDFVCAGVIPGPSRPPLIKRIVIKIKRTIAAILHRDTF